jgi:hypothetical protein
MWTSTHRAAVRKIKSPDRQAADRALEAPVSRGQPVIEQRQEGKRGMINRIEGAGRTAADIAKILKHSRRLPAYGFSSESILSAVAGVLADLRADQISEQLLTPLVAFAEAQRALVPRTEAA